jgi:hypothetical protein
VKFVLIILLFLFLSEAKTAYASELDSSKGIQSIVFISVGMPFSSGSNDYFATYLNEFKGNHSDLELLPLIGAGTKIRFGDYRVGAQFYVLSSNLQDSYSEIVESEEFSGYREYAQSIEITDIPIIFTFEYIPYTSQFRTYVGGGAGFLLRNTSWLESVRSGIPLDRRVGGNIYDDTDLFPFLKIYSGIELGFDKRPQDSFLGSLVIEASYNYSIGGADLFSIVRRQFVPQSPELNKKVNILPGYLVITLAVTFNFNQKSRL